MQAQRFRGERLGLDIAELRRVAAVVLDALLLSGLLGLVVFLVGGIQWESPLFTLSLTRPKNPVRLMAFSIGVKLLFGLHGGFLARMGRGRSPIAFAARFLDAAQVLPWLRAHGSQLLLAALAAGAAGLAVEGYLRRFPESLPTALANYVANGYDAGPSGIYRYDAGMHMLRMRPNFEREMWFNGYRWHHRTDGMGFRNPREMQHAHVLLLGDSMIYGHGVEETSTVRHHLERTSGRAVANLGIQGAGIHQEYQVLKRYGVPLQPRWVFLFFLVNDLDDLIATLSEEEMRRFLALPIGDHETPYFDTAPSVSARFRAYDYWRELYVARALEFLPQYLELDASTADAAEPSWRHLPPFRNDPARTLAMKFHLRALRKIQDLARRHDFHFVHYFISTRGFRDQEPYYRRVLEAFCRARGISFYDLGEAFRTSRYGQWDLLLPGDGHLSDLGAQVTAAELARHVENEKTPEPDR